jgi:hypothetical protein
VKKATLPLVEPIFGIRDAVTKGDEVFNQALVASLLTNSRFLYKVMLPI